MTDIGEDTAEAYLPIDDRGREKIDEDVAEVCPGSYTPPTWARAGNKGKCRACGTFVSLIGTSEHPTAVDAHFGGNHAPTPPT